jgi:ABC-type multidrug transport system ATPase subunit
MPLCLYNVKYDYSNSLLVEVHRLVLYAETKTILKGVSGKFEHGTLTAILGPSGAGKSSLMNVIAGYRVQNVDGDVLLNRRRRDMDAFRKLACYIMQEDRLIDELTAYESLVYSAHLKLARNAVSESERIALINEIMELMGLAQCAHTRVAKLSGGQRKRLSIALELVQNTPILLLDEPTT